MQKTRASFYVLILARLAMSRNMIFADSSDGDFELNPERFSPDFPLALIWINSSAAKFLEFRRILKTINAAAYRDNFLPDLVFLD